MTETSPTTDPGDDTLPEESQPSEALPQLTLLTAPREGVPEVTSTERGLMRAAEADETIKRRKAEEVALYIQRLMPLEALRIRGRHNATNALS